MRRLTSLGSLRSLAFFLRKAAMASSAAGIGAGPVALAVAAGFVVLAVVSVMNLQKLES